METMLNTGTCWEKVGSPAPSSLTWALIGALLLHPAVVGGAVSVAGQGDGRSCDADAGLSVLVVPDPAARQIRGPASLGQLTHRAGGQRRVALCRHICRVSDPHPQEQRT